MLIERVEEENQKRDGGCDDNWYEKREECEKDTKDKVKWKYKTKVAEPK